jgi:hypothetical protein
MRSAKYIMVALLFVLVVPNFIQSGASWSSQLDTVTFTTPQVTFTDAVGMFGHLTKLFDDDNLSFSYFTATDYNYPAWPDSKHINDAVNIEFDAIITGQGSNGMFEMLVTDNLWKNNLFSFTEARAYQAEIFITLTGQTQNSYRIWQDVGLGDNINFGTNWATDNSNVRILQTGIGYTIYTPSPNPILDNGQYKTHVKIVLRSYGYGLGGLSGIFIPSSDKGTSLQVFLREIRMRYDSIPVVSRLSTIPSSPYTVRDNVTLNYNCYIDFYNNQRYSGGSYSIYDKLGTDDQWKKSGSFVTGPMSQISAFYPFGPQYSNILQPGVHTIRCDITSPVIAPNPTAQYTVTINNDLPIINIKKALPSPMEYGTVHDFVFTIDDLQYKSGRTWKMKLGTAILEDDDNWIVNQNITYTLNTTTFGVGNHTLKLEVDDFYRGSYGEAIKIFELPIEIKDTIAPSLHVETDLSVPWSSAPPVMVTASDKSPFTLSMTILDNGVPATFAFHLNQTNLYQINSEFIGFYNGLGDGYYGYSILVNDTSGNSAIVSELLNKDSTPPVIYIQQPQDYVYWNTTKEIKTVIDDLSETTCELKYDSQGKLMFQYQPWYYVFNSSVAGFSQFTSYFMSQSDGVLEFQIRAEDAAHNIQYKKFYVIKDTQSAGLSITVPQFTATSLTIAYGANESITSWDYKLDENNWVALDKDLSAATIDIEALDDGIHNISLRAIDYAGNRAEQTYEFTKDVVLPIVDVISPESIFEHIFSINVNSDENITIGVTKAGITVPYTQTLNGLIYSVMIEDSQLSYGSNILVVKTTDRAGNFVNTEITIAKVESKVSFTLNLQGSYSAGLLFGSSIPIVTMNLNANLTAYNKYLYQNDTEITSVGDIWNTLSSGWYNLTWMTVSEFGRIQIITKIVEKDITTPVVSILLPTMNDFVGEQSPMYSISVTESHINNLYYTIGTLTKAIVNLNGYIDQEIWDNSLTEYVTINFTCEDLCGNTQTASISVRRTDWIGPNGNQIDIDLFFNMGIGTWILCLSVMGAVFGVSMIYQKKKVQNGGRAA